ncbi:hypothetical protein ACI2LC_28170 [Nonomuraea wenchangensis]|uniref:hypothetical protein n=1 Tax=Nonomuraea wenchangensis TaxID=568860 RepID=UPI00384CFF22
MRPIRRSWTTARQSLATGQLLRVSPDGTGARLVNAGHPWPLQPRELVRTLTGAVIDACHGHLQDDAGVLCLDRHGPRRQGRRTHAGADT